MSKKDNRFWVWGYTLDKVPGPSYFVNGPTSCSLETAADYLGCSNLCWMNSLHSMDAICDQNFTRLERFESILCGLTHIEHDYPGSGKWEMFYKESAAKIAEYSRKYPNIKGVILDDFRAPEGPSGKLTDEDLHVINAAMKEVNPDLKLYLVQYHTRQDFTKLESCSKDFDGLSIWSWRSTDYFWNALYEDDIMLLRRLFPDKDIIQGQFIHAYGDAGGAQPMDQMILQCNKIAKELDRNSINGWCALQSGYFCRLDHREQVEYLKNFWNWFRDTHTIL
ncbi:MAG: hypothetical protein E7058_05800 [Lentisphaerae bacterium]|nr:hypothetical protein [Lentisphaerota bacterium]